MQRFWLIPKSYTFALIWLIVTVPYFAPTCFASKLSTFAPCQYGVQCAFTLHPFSRACCNWCRKNSAKRSYFELLILLSTFKKIELMPECHVLGFWFCCQFSLLNGSFQVSTRTSGLCHRFCHHHHWFHNCYHIIFEQ